MPVSATRVREGAACRVHAALLLVAVLLVAVVYGGSLANDFVWDDEQVIVNNPLTRDLSKIGVVLSTPDEVSPYYRPLNRASYLLDYHLFGLRPGAFHAVNVTLHAACVVALYALAFQLSARRGAAFAAAALLAVHPVNSEAVNFVTARNNLFALLFSLLAVWFFLRAKQSGSPAWSWASGAAFLLGLASKEQAAMALVVIAVVAVLDHPRGTGPQGGARPAMLALPYVLAVVVYLAARRIALDAVVTPGSGAAGAGLWSRLAADWDIIPRYVGLVVFPKTLTTFHTVAGPRPLWPFAAWIGILAAVALMLRTGDRTVRFGLLWFGVNLLPIANIIPIPSAAMAERYLYVPAAGLWIALGALWNRLYVAPGWRRVAIGVGAVLLVLFGARTLIRTAEWRDDVTLFRSAVAANPAATAARLSLAVALKDRGDFEGARREWNEVLRREPGNADALTQSGTATAVQGDLATAETLYRRALDSDPRSPMALFNLGRLCERTGRPAEALEFYRRFLTLRNDLYREYRPVAEDRVRALGNGAAPRR